MKFEKIANEWLLYKKNGIEISTYYDYKRIIESQLKPKFKNININEIMNLNEYVQELNEKFAPSSIRKTISVLKAIISYYEEEYDCKIKIKKLNMPKIAKSNVEVFTKKEQTKIEKYCLKENTLETLGIVVALNTGLRIGELCGLKFESIDLKERKIYVRETVERVYDCENKKSILIIKRPKTESSIRSVPISNKLYKILKPLKSKYRDNDYLLTGNEKPMDPRTYENIFNNILKKIGIKHKSFHCLRHTFATNCIEIGMDIKTLSEVLGHSDSKITSEIYVHPSDKLKKKYMEML